MSSRGTPGGRRRSTVSGARSPDGARATAGFLRVRLWPVPALSIIAAVAAGVAMPQLDERIVPRLPTAMTDYLFGGGPEAARGVLAAVAGSLITVTSLTFSLTVVTLQLASSQYSPRLLRTFTQDRFVQNTLAILLATFTFALTVLRTVRTEQGDQPAFVPQLSVTLAYFAALVSTMGVAVFLGHLARQIRVETMLRDVHVEASRAVRRLLAEPQPDGPAPAPALDRAETPVCARRSGFLTWVDEKRLLAAAVQADALVYVERRPGESVIAGTPVARVRAGGPGWPDEATRDALASEVEAAVTTGFERTPDQDITFGLRQLVDVAVKALSPSVNDPTTAVHALGHAAALLCELVDLQPGPRRLADDDGRIRVVLARPALPELLELVLDQPRRYGAAEPAVLARLLMLLREVAWIGRDAGLRATIVDQLARTGAVAAAQELDRSEQARLAELAAAVERALDGRWDARPPVPTGDSGDPGLA